MPKNIKNEEDVKEFLGMALGMAAEKEDGSYTWLPEFKSRQGRTVFYPTFFDKIGREVINPHSRKRRAGRGPVFYETVPEGTEGIVQIVYIPSDAVLKTDEEVKKEAEQDLLILIKALEKAKDRGIGAKSKLGWGRFEFCPDQKRCFLKGWGKEGIKAEGLKGWQVNITGG